MNTLKKFKALNEEIKALTKELKPIKDEIIAKLKKRKTPLVEGAFKAELKTIMQSRFDSKALKESDLDTYNQFLNDIEVNRLTVI